MSRVFLVSCLCVVFLSPVSCSKDATISHPPLRCCFMNEPPISFFNPQVNFNGGLDGYIAEYFRELQSHLGLTCSSITQFTPTDNTGFNVFIKNLDICTSHTTGQVRKSPNCRCDIGVGGWFTTVERYGKVDFIQPFTHEKFVVFTSRENTSASANRLFFVETFDRKSWLCISGMFVMFTVLKLLDRGFAPAGLYTPATSKDSVLVRFCICVMKTPVLYRLRKGIQSTTSRMLLMPDDSVVVNGKSTRQWFLNIIISACSLFLILSYEASMTASLVQESVSSSYKTLDDFKTCRIDPRKVCLLRGGALEHHWNNSVTLDDCHRGKKSTFTSSYDELFKNVEEDKCTFGIGMEKTIKWELHKRPCGEFIIIGEPVWNSGLSMVLPRNSSLTAPMSQATLEYLRNGSKHGVEESYFGVNGCNSDVPVTLTYWKLRLFFVLSFSVGGFIFLWMLLHFALRAEKARNIRVRALADMKKPSADSDQLSDSGVMNRPSQDSTQYSDPL